MPPSLHGKIQYRCIAYTTSIHARSFPCYVRVTFVSIILLFSSVCFLFFYTVVNTFTNIHTLVQHIR